MNVTEINEYENTSSVSPCSNTFYIHEIYLSLTCDYCCRYIAYSWIEDTDAMKHIIQSIIRSWEISRSVDVKNCGYGEHLKPIFLPIFWNASQKEVLWFKWKNCVEITGARGAMINWFFVFVSSNLMSHYRYSNRRLI